MPIAGRSRISVLSIALTQLRRRVADRQRGALSVEIRLKLYQAPIASGDFGAAAGCLAGAARGERPARRDPFLGADRGPRRRELRRPVRKLPRYRRRGRIPHRRARLLGGAVDHQRAPLHGQSRAQSRRYRDGGADPAARCRARLRRRPERDRRRPDADQRDLGARHRDRARRGGAGPHRAVSARVSCARSSPAARIIATPCGHGGTAPQAVPAALVREPCLDAGQAVTLGRLLRKAEDRDRHAGRDRVGARRLDAGSFGLQAAAGAAAPCRSRRTCRTRSGSSIPASTVIPPASAGAPAVPWWSIANANSRASRPATYLVTRVAGPALAHILPRVAGVVAELGGSTSHLASLARERGIPMVLGVLDATRRIPDGSQVAVDGVAGVVRWLR